VYVKWFIFRAHIHFLNKNIRLNVSLPWICLCVIYLSKHFIYSSTGLIFHKILHESYTNRCHQIYCIFSFRSITSNSMEASQTWLERKYFPGFCICLYHKERGCPSMNCTLLFPQLIYLYCSIVIKCQNRSLAISASCTLYFSLNKKSSFIFRLIT